MESILAAFSSLLRERLSRETFTTEDSIRYTFFAALLRDSHLAPHDIVLEYPHPQIPGAEVDTFLPVFGGRPLAIEFKYDRRIPSGASVPRPQNAGELFKDISRLIRLDMKPEPVRVLVYLTDAVMAGYFANPKNGHAAFFGLPCGQRLRIDSTYISGKATTFQRNAGADLAAILECRWSEELPRGHHLRIYEVLAIADAV